MEKYKMNAVINEYYYFFLNHHHKLSDYYKTKEYIKLSEEEDELEKKLLDLLEDKKEMDVEFSVASEEV